MPTNHCTLSVAMDALEELRPLLTPDLFTVQLADGPGGWGILLYGPEGQSMDRLAGRLGLHEQPERSRQDGQQQTRYRCGSRSRVAVSLATATHVVRRVRATG